VSLSFSFFGVLGARRFGTVGSDSQHFPSLAKPVRREMTFSRARARSSVLSDMPLAFALSSRWVAATSPSASSRPKKATAWSIRFGPLAFCQSTLRSVVADDWLFRILGHLTNSPQAVPNR
jgi:hypothetical protein